MSKQSELTKLINNLNKKYGVNAVQFGSEVKEQKEIKRIPTGIVSLDIALGGGIPIGRYTQIEGAYSSTKTTLSLHIIQEAQKMGLVCAMIDGEGTTDKKYMKQIGIDTDKILYIQPDGLEEAIDVIIAMQRSGEVDLALIDSLAVLKPIKELESDADETVQLGITPKLLNEFFGKYQMSNNRLTREGYIPFTLIGTNQLREKIGVMFGDPEYAPGGRAKDFCSSVNIRLRRGDWLSQGKESNKEIIGQVVKFKISKNKTYKRMQTGEFDFYFAENELDIPVGYYDNFKSIIVESIMWGLIDRGGAWYYLNKGKEDEIKFQGMDNLVDYFRENPETINIYRNKIIDLAIKLE